MPRTIRRSIVAWYRSKKKEAEERTIKKFNKYVESHKTIGREASKVDDVIRDHNWPYHEEFRRKKLPLTSFRQSWERGVRVFAIASNRVFEPTAIASLCLTGTAVLSIGCYEGLLLCSEASAHSIEFSLSYGFQNMGASCVWATKRADLIAISCGFEPEVVLREFTRSVEDSKTLLAIHNCAIARSIIAGFMIIAQLLRVINISMYARSDYRKRIIEGMEPPLRNGVLERVIRICGSTSECTMLSLERYEHHILPVYEQEFPRHALMWHLTKGGINPMYWIVKRGAYGFQSSWEEFTVYPRFFIRSTTGKRILYMEADATNSEDSLHLGSLSRDLGFDDALQAFRMIEKAAKAQGKRNPPFRSIRVFLGDAAQEELSGTHEITLRQRFEEKKEVDVLIDSKAPVISAILSWSERAIARSSDCLPNALQKTIIFDTNCSEYFENLKAILSLHDITVVDPVAAADALSDNENGGELQWLIPRFLHYRTTSETINAAYSLNTVMPQESSRQCAVLIDMIEGLSALEDLKSAQKQRGVPQFHVLCSAEIYDDLFRQVRVWVRTGHSVAAIQHSLDRRYVDRIGSSSV